MPQMPLPMTTALPALFQNAVQIVSMRSLNALHRATIEAVTAITTDSTARDGS